jgi:hypothetical protein
MRFVEDGLVRGQYLVLDVHKAPLLDESGAMIGTVGCGRDITRERKIHKDLIESRASQQLLMETASDFAVFRLQVNLDPPQAVERDFYQSIGQRYRRHYPIAAGQSVVPGLSG